MKSIRCYDSFCILKFLFVIFVIIAEHMVDDLIIDIVRVNLLFIV